MAIAILNSKGQITLPKSVRERLGVEAGDRIEFFGYIRISQRSIRVEYGHS